MASAAIYDNAITELSRGGIDWEGETVKALFVGEDYAPDQCEHGFRSDVLGEVASSGTYRKGGLTLNGRRIEHDPLNNQVRWLGGMIICSNFTGAFRYVVLYAARGGPASDDPLISCSDMGPQMASNSEVRITYEGGVCEFSVQPIIEGSGE